MKLEIDPITELAERRQAPASSGLSLPSRDLLEAAHRRDLSDIAGAWIEDPEVDRALEEQRKIDPELWRWGPSSIPTDIVETGRRRFSPRSHPRGIVRTPARSKFKARRRSKISSSGRSAGQP